MRRHGITGRLAAYAGALLVTGCTAAPPDTDLVWAVNVGGPAYDGVDGTRYEAEVSVTGGEQGVMESVKGSQDPSLYMTYRTGDIRIDRPVANGTYDITFHFAEPEEVGGGERLFDVRHHVPFRRARRGRGGRASL